MSTGGEVHKPITGEELAHTMALCGVDDVRSVPRDTVVPAR